MLNVTGYWECRTRYRTFRIIPKGKDFTRSSTMKASARTTRPNRHWTIWWEATPSLHRTALIHRVVDCPANWRAGILSGQGKTRHASPGSQAMTWMHRNRNDDGISAAINEIRDSSDRAAAIVAAA